MIFFLDANILQYAEKHFPFLYVEPSTLQHLKYHQSRQIDCLTKPEPLLPSSVSRKIENMQQRQQALLKVVQKDLAHARRLQEYQAKCYHEKYVRMALHCKRLAAAKARQYFQDYELQLKLKLQRARTGEEQLFIKTFEDGLKVQRVQVRDAKKSVREKESLLQNQVCEQLESMEKQYPISL